MGFQEYRKFKRLSGWSQTSEECVRPRRRRASIKTYQVALIREPHQPVKGQVIVCARSLRNSPSKVNCELWVQPSPPTLFKENTELCGLGRKKKSAGRRLCIVEGKWINKSQGVTLLGHWFLLHLSDSLSGQKTQLHGRILAWADMASPSGSCSATETCQHFLSDVGPKIRGRTPRH